MAYFPNDLMPLTPKTDAAVGTSPDKMISQDYNLHDQEIQAIESYLGFSSQTAPTRPFRGNGGPPLSIFDRVRILIEKLNGLSLNGISASSGLALSGPKSSSPSSIVAQKMIAPGLAKAAFLTQSVSEFDTSINVISTSGFPDSGILSLVAPLADADAGLFTVEHIFYGSKNGSQFTNCQRGWLETRAISIIVGETSPPQANAADDCFSPDTASLNLCKNRWPAFNKPIISIDPLGISGTREWLLIQIMSRPLDYPLEPDSADMSAIRSAADGLGILKSENGRFYLQSADAYAASQKRLTGMEASDFLEAVLGIKATTVPPSSMLVGTDAVPVFLGQVSVQYTPAYFRKLPSSKSGFGIIVGGLGEQGGFRPALSENQGDISYGGVGYQIFSIPVPRSNEELL